MNKLRTKKTGLRKDQRDTHENLKKAENKIDQSNQNNANSPADESESSKFMKLKQEGNEALQNLDFSKAIELYTEALQLIPPKDPQKATCYTNRALAHLKMVF